MNSDREKEKNSADGVDYMRLFERSPQAMALFRADHPDYTIVAANAAYEAMVGKRRKSFLNKPFLSMFPDVSETYKLTGKSAIIEHFHGQIRSEEPVLHQVLRYDIPDSTGRLQIHYWDMTHELICSTKGEITHILSSSQDITGELQSKNRMEQTEEQLKAALSIGKVGSWEWNLNDDTTTFNAVVAAFLGVPWQMGKKGAPLDQMIGVVHSDDRARVSAALENVRTGTRPFDEEFRLYTSTGRLRWVLVRGRREQGGDPHRVVGVIIDITERHNLQAQVKLAQQQDKLNREAAKILHERNEELEAVGRTKDEFVALASHQLRTPATAVKQYLGMVLQGYVGDISDMQAEMLTKAFESNERQIQIINQILNAARVDTGKLVLTPAPVELRSLVQGIVNDMKSMFDAHSHKLRLSLPKLPLRVDGDMGYLRMAIENIVNNAIIYTPDGGEIGIKLSRVGQYCKLVVSDTGVGIRKADLHKLFIKFSRIHNPLSVQAGGSGIGLYLAAEIIRLHRGKISADSELGKGTTFAISLPLVQNTT